MKTSHLAMTAGSMVLSAGLFFTGYGLSRNKQTTQARAEIAAPVDKSYQVASNAPVGNSGLSNFDAAGLYSQVYDLLKEDYVEPFDKNSDTSLSYGTVRGLLAQLEDPASRLLEPEEVKVYNENLQGRFSGLGAVLTVDHRTEKNIQQNVLEVVAPQPGSPAEKAGLKAGDVIDSIDGQWVLSYNLSEDLEPLRKAIKEKKASQADLVKAAREAQAKLDNAILISDAMKKLGKNADAPVRLGIKRANAKPFEVSVKLQPTTVKQVDYKAFGDTGYIQVRGLNEAVVKDFNSALTTLSPRIKSLVIDLRDNAGMGEANASSLLNSMLPKNTTFVIREAKKDAKASRQPLKAGSAKFDHPVVVLINQGTYGVTEVVANALKQNASARLIGTRTHGDWMARKQFPFKDGSMVVLTTGKYFTPKNEDLQGKGVKPDIEVQSTGNFGEPAADAPLKRALEVLGGKR